MTRNSAGLDPVEEVLAFLRCRTPDAWFEQAPNHLPELLIDHANCEKKAAGAALSLLYRYVDRPELLRTLSRLAREELRHFEQVLTHMAAWKIDYVHLPASRYAAAMRAAVRPREPARLVDTLLVGAIVEARSCERFVGLIEVLPKELGGFYRRLLDSEARHYGQYLDLARHYAKAPITEPLDQLLALDAELVTAVDREFRFHSGPLAQKVSARHSS